MSTTKVTGAKKAPAKKKGPAKAESSEITFTQEQIDALLEKVRAEARAEFEAEAEAEAVRLIGPTRSFKECIKAVSEMDGKVLTRAEQAGAWLSELKAVLLLEIGLKAEVVREDLRTTSNGTSDFNNAQFDMLKFIQHVDIEAWLKDVPQEVPFKIVADLQAGANEFHSSNQNNSNAQNLRDISSVFGNM